LEERSGMVDQERFFEDGIVVVEEHWIFLVY
jgi:hypothetical protein